MHSTESFGLSKSVIDEIVRVIRSHGRPSRIILFGSRTRGDFDERSDIDLAVDGGVDPLLARGYLEEEVRTLRKFDVVHISDLGPEMLRSVNDEGVILYDETVESPHHI
jgi:uncharacterized protein